MKPMKTVIYVYFVISIICGADNDGVDMDRRLFEVLTRDTLNENLKEYNYKKINVIKSSNPNIRIPVPQEFNISFELAEALAREMLFYVKGRKPFAVAVDTNAFFFFSSELIDAEKDLSLQLHNALAIRGKDGKVRNPLSSSWMLRGVVLDKSHNVLSNLKNGMSTEFIYIEYGLPLDGIIWIAKENHWYEHHLDTSGEWVLIDHTKHPVEIKDDIKYSHGYMDYLCLDGKIRIHLNDGKIMSYVLIDRL